MLKQLLREAQTSALTSEHAKALINEQVARALTTRTVSGDARGTPLAKTVLEQIMLLSMGLVAKYQPGKPDENEAKMQEYLPYALGAAKELARYQSPTFRAIAVTEVPALPAAQPGDGAKVVGLMGKRTQLDAANAYTRIIRNDPKAA